MKASVRWLRELCPHLPDDPSIIASRLTAAGLEVETITPFGSASDACVVVRVVGARPHPSRSGLRLVTVDRGGGTSQEVVCGAPNVPDPGGLVVLAPLGVHLPAKDMTIERRTIAGVPSEGMLCSEAELGLGGDASGILVLEPGTCPPGLSLARALPAARDTILELSLTPNRPDALGHLGLAREAAALFRVPFAPERPPPPARREDGDLSRYVMVTIEDGERCAFYGAAVILGAEVAPSPADLRWRLTSLDVRPISNLVDITNLTMLEFGHPTHAFDLDRVRGATIRVRRARSGEPLKTLDGVDRALTADDLVICDGDGPVALAGVMGGGNSEITERTTRVLFECATFDPRSVRRTARRHGLHTEASHRFERGVDWGDSDAVLARAVSMGCTVAHATAVMPWRVFEGRTPTRKSVSLRHARTAELLGVEAPAGETRDILGRLGFDCQRSEAESDVWKVPSHRPDVSCEADLVEEVGRVRGYELVPTVLPALHPTRDHGPRERLMRRVRRAAVAMGLSEAVTYAFISPSDIQALGAPPAVVELRNPLAEQQSVMRTTLLPGLLQAASGARRRGERSARLFTVGAVFLGSGETLPEERLSFAALLVGDRPGWLEKPQAVDVWDAKGLAEDLILRLHRRDVTVRPASGAARPVHLHPRGAAWIEVAGTRMGTLGPLHPDVTQAFDVGADAVVVEIDLAALESVGPRALQFSPLPRFPASSRDLAVVVPESVTAGEIEDAARGAAGDLAEEVALFDRFVGEAIPKGYASLALHIVYRAPDRTLTDTEVDERHARVVADVEKRFGAKVRE
jgi:phenylalanyl-tRNA synthetase beta chain